MKLRRSSLSFVLALCACGGSSGGDEPAGDAAFEDSASAIDAISGDAIANDSSKSADDSDASDATGETAIADALSEASDGATDARPPTISANAIVFMHGNLEFVPEDNPKKCSIAGDGPGWHSNLDDFFGNPVLALADKMGVQHPLIDMPIGDGGCTYPWGTGPTIDPAIWKKPHVAMSSFSSGRDAVWEFFVAKKGAIPPSLDCVVVYDPCYVGTPFSTGAASAKAWLALAPSHSFVMVEGGCSGALYDTDVGPAFTAQFAGSSNFHIIDDRKTSPDHFSTLSNHLDLQWTAGCPALIDIPTP